MRRFRLSVGRCHGNWLTLDRVFDRQPSPSQLGDPLSDAYNGGWQIPHLRRVL